MMEETKKSFNKKIVLIGIAIVLVVVLPILMWLIRSNQDQRSGATAGTVAFSLFEATKNVPANTEFEVEVRLNPNGVSVKTFEYTVRYSPTHLQFVSFTPANGITELSNNQTEDAPNYKFYKFSGYSSPNITTQQTIGKLRFKVLAANGTTMPVDFQQAIAANSVNGQVTSYPVDFSANGRYTVGNTTTGSVNFFFEPASATAQPGQTITLALKTTTNSNPLNSLSATVTFPANKLSIQTLASDFTPATGFTFPIKQLTSGQLLLEGVTSTAINGTSQTIGTIKFTVPSNATVGPVTVGLNVTGTDPSYQKSSSPATITIANSSTQTPATVLGFTSTATTHTQGNNFRSNVTINTNGNSVTNTDLIVKFNSAVLEALDITAGSFLPSTTVITKTLDNTNGKIVYSFYTSATNAKTGTGNLAKITWKAKAAGTSQVSFENPTTIVTGAGGTNLISQTSPITFTVNASSTSTPTPTPTRTPTPTPSAIPTATPTLAAGETALRFSFTLPGIGKISGDNATPSRTNRSVTISIYNASNNLVGSPRNANAVYNSTHGAYEGQLNLGSNFASGSYIVKIKVDNSLYKRVPGIVEITSASQTNSAVSAQLVTGDINQDNVLSVEDYSAVVACYQARTACTNSIKNLADINDNGQTTDDLDDFAILQRGFAIRNGD